MDDGNHLRLDRQICFPLYAASNLFARAYRPLLAPLGLTYPQYLVMMVLWEGESQTVGAIGTRLYLDSGTLTPVLKRMEAAGLVTRRRDEHDERRVVIELTDAGKALRARTRHVPMTLGKALNVSKDEERALRGLVGKLRNLLGEQEHESAGDARAQAG